MVFDNSFSTLPESLGADRNSTDKTESLLKPVPKHEKRKKKKLVLLLQNVCFKLFVIVAILTLIGSLVHWFSKHPMGKVDPTKSISHPKAVVELKAPVLPQEQLPSPSRVMTPSEQTGTDSKPNDQNLGDETLTPVVLDSQRKSDTQYDGDSVVGKQEIDCTPPVHDPEQYHLHLWQSTPHLSWIQHANENNLKFLPDGTTIHTLSDDDLVQSMKSLSVKLKECAGIGGAFQAFLDLRPMAYRTDLYRAAQLWDTGGLWMDDKIWLMKDFSTFVNVEQDTILFPNDIGKDPASGVHYVWNGFMWSRPRHIVLEHIIRHIIGNVQSRSYGTGAEPWLAKSS